MSDAAQRRDNRRLFAKLGVIVVAMFGFGYALVPFYEKICEVTGLRELARADEVTNTQVDATRTVRIELDSNVRKLPWQFRPLTPVVGVHPGELKQVVYEIVNTTDRPLTGQAIPSYGPPHAAQYFRKLECFCFAKQTLAPGESRQMPVVFVLDPGLPGDVATITLSYTFFEVEGADKS
jgi:cytochrome c oxidase assembly protein subunit 11